MFLSRPKFQQLTRLSPVCAVHCSITASACTQTTANAPNAFCSFGLGVSTCIHFIIYTHWELLKRASSRCLRGGVKRRSGRDRTGRLLCARQKGVLTGVLPCSSFFTGTNASPAGGRPHRLSFSVLESSLRCTLRRAQRPGGPSQWCRWVLETPPVAL